MDQEAFERAAQALEDPAASPDAIESALATIRARLLVHKARHFCEKGAAAAAAATAGAFEAFEFWASMYSLAAWAPCPVALESVARACADSEHSASRFSVVQGARAAALRRAAQRAAELAPPEAAVPASPTLWFCE